MSTQAQFSQTDLVLRFVGGKRDGSLVPVSTSKCLLGKDKTHEAKCAIYRSSRGTTVKSLVSGVTVNGDEIDISWLREGDRLKVGKSVLQVQQIGFCEGRLEEQELPEQSASPNLPRLNQSEGSNATSIAKPSLEEEKILSPLTAVSSNVDTNSAADPNIKTLPSQAGTPVADQVSFAGATGVEPSAPNFPSVSPVAPTTQDLSEDAIRDRVATTAETIESLTNRLFDPSKNEPTTSEATANALSDQLNALLGDAKVQSASSPVDTVRELTPNSTPAIPMPSTEANPESSSAIPEGSLLSQFKAEPEPQPEPEEKEPFQQESVADILARMQEQGDIDTSFEEANSPEVEPVVESPTPMTPVAPTPTASATPTPTPPPVVAPAGGNGEDGSVQDYMNSLFQRLRGGDSPDPIQPTSVENTNVTTAAASEAAVTEMQVRAEAEDAPLTADEFKPKTMAPERVVNMDAMRELANAQARNAILLSQSKRRKAITLTCLGIVAFGLGMAGYTFATADGIDVPFMIGASCVMISCAAAYRCASAFLGWDLETVEHRTFGESVESQPMEEPVSAPTSNL